MAIAKTKSQSSGLFRPFQNESDTVDIDDLTIENRTDRIALYGSLSITRDKAGLAAALALKQTVDAVVEALKSEALPDKVQDAKSATVKNPFSPT